MMPSLPASAVSRAMRVCRRRMVNECPGKTSALPLRVRSMIADAMVVPDFGIVRKVRGQYYKCSDQMSSGQLRFHRARAVTGIFGNRLEKIRTLIK
jgi:hypothetical protein